MLGKIKINPLILITIFSIFIALLAVWFLVKEIKIKSSELIDAKSSTIMLTVQDQEVKKFIDNYLNYEPQLEIINQSFADSENLVDVIKFIEESAIQANIEIHISLPESQSQINYSSIQFFSRNEFSKILHFLKIIENGPYLIEINDLSIRRIEGAQASLSQVDASFYINILIK